MREGYFNKYLLIAKLILKSYLISLNLTIWTFINFIASKYSTGISECVII